VNANNNTTSEHSATYFTRAMPIITSRCARNGGCESAAPAYGKLIGLCLLKDFRKRVRELLGGDRGCTHLTEMLAGMPTAAIQTFAGETKEDRDDGTRPFQLDQCLALETSGETVKKWYPKWHKKEGGKAKASA